MDDKNSSLPGGWLETQLGSVIQLSKKKIHPSECPDTPYISLEHIESNSNKIKNNGIAQDVKSTKSVFNDGDILYGRLRPYLNKVTIPNFSGICSTDILVLKTTGAIENRFLLKFLSQNSFVQYAHANSSGINLPRVNFKTISEHSINLPPINEQQRISNKIEALQTKSKKAKQALETAKPLLEKLKQSILASAFRGELTADWREKNPDVEPASVLLESIRKERRKKWEENELAKMRDKGKEPKDDKWKSKYKEPEPVDKKNLPELPNGWCWASLKDISWSSGYGTSKKCDLSGQGEAVLRIPNIKFGEIDTNNIKYSLTSLGLIEQELIAEGDFLIIRTNGSKDLIGRSAIITKKMDNPTYFASYIIRYRLLGHSPLHNWTNSIWESSYFRQIIEIMSATSAGQFNISMTKLDPTPLPIPPENEINEINIRLRKLFEKWKNIKTILSNIENETTKLNQSILNKAFKGELVKQNPEEEPASELLQKIK